MLQTPINVLPQNTTLNADDVAITSFTVKGDHLTGIYMRVKDYNTDEIVYESYYPVSWYNNNKWSASFSGLINGHDYVSQYMLMQKDLNTESPVYDIAVLGGTITIKQSEIGTPTNLYVDGQMEDMYSWDSSDTVRYPTVVDNTVIAGMVIRINNESRFITSYTFSENDNEGIIEIDEPFSFTVTSGMRYMIYSNYIITPQYFFKARSKPTVSLSHDISSNRLYVSGVYSQPEWTSIKYYTLKLYWSNNGSFYDVPNRTPPYRTILIEESNPIYSQEISYEFWQPYRHDEDIEPIDKDYYKAVCTVVTQDNVEYSFESNVIAIEPMTEDNTSLDYGDTLHSFNLEYDKTKGRTLFRLIGYGSAGTYTHVENFELFRKNMNNGEIVSLRPKFYTREGEYHEIMVGYDITASTQAKYQYCLIGINEGGRVVCPIIDESYDGLGKFPRKEITISDNAYYIYGLDLVQPYNSQEHHLNFAKKTKYVLGDAWKIIGEIQDTTTTNNLNRETHVGYGKYICNTSTDTNYLSGTLTAMLGYVDCVSHEYKDDIELVNAWRKFITQPKPFLLKTQKGDTLIVNVIESPTVAYQENTKQIPSTISFTWAECDDIANVDIYDENPFV